MTAQPYAIVAVAACSVDGRVCTVGEVVNIIMWDGVSPFAPPPGTELRPAGSAQIGQKIQT